MEKNKFSLDIFKKVKEFKCPCCHIDYSDEYESLTDKHTYMFDEGFGSGSAMQTGDTRFVCGNCHAEFQLDRAFPDNALLIKKAKVEPTLYVTNEKNIREVLEQFSNISNVSIDSKTGELSCIDANGKKYSVNIIEAIMCQKLAGEKVKHDIENYLEAEHENAAIDKVNEELKNNSNAKAKGNE